jgi:Asp/Glu/hydantoin racemase
MAQAPRIVLLHATPVAIDPIKESFAVRWPEAEIVNLLDDSLSVDRAKDSELTDRIIDRFFAFGSYAHSIGADAILATCSAFGPAIERLANELPIPVLKPNEAMFEAALTQGRKIGMIATFAPSLVTMEQEFEEFVRETGQDATLTSVVANGAMDALRGGDAETHNELVAERAPELSDCDAIMLAHFSTSRALLAVRKKVDARVLTAPDAAVEKLIAALEQSEKSGMP